MSQEKELKAFTDGEYVFSETEEANQFYFYRQDGQVLGEVGRIPMDMYQNYMCMKMFESDTPEMVANNIRFDTSEDGKCIRLTTFAFGQKDPIIEEDSIKKEETKGIKKLVKSLFNRSKKN